MFSTTASGMKRVRQPALVSAADACTSSPGRPPPGNNPISVSASRRYIEAPWAGGFRSRRSLPADVTSWWTQLSIAAYRDTKLASALRGSSIPDATPTGSSANPAASVVSQSGRGRRSASQIATRSLAGAAAMPSLRAADLPTRLGSRTQRARSRLLAQRPRTSPVSSSEASSTSTVNSEPGGYSCRSSAASRCSRWAPSLRAAVITVTERGSAGASPGCFRGSTAASSSTTRRTEKHSRTAATVHVATASTERG